MYLLTRAFFIVLASGSHSVVPYPWLAASLPVMTPSIGPTLLRAQRDDRHPVPVTWVDSRTFLSVASSVGRVQKHGFQKYNFAM
jgi:hypothetical protein